MVRRKTSLEGGILFLLKKHPTAGIAFLGGIVMGYLLFPTLNPTWNVSPGEATVSVCFTPGGKCTDLIIQEIRKAERRIRVQAYSFTSHPLAQALIEAFQRGVDVKVLLDKSQFGDPRSVLKLLQKHHIPVKQERVSGLAHNKVIVIDDRAVITGSFNLTQEAEKRNSENVVLIQDPHIVEAYLSNWEKRG